MQGTSNPAAGALELCWLSGFQIRAGRGFWADAVASVSGILSLPFPQPHLPKGIPMSLLALCSHIIRVEEQGAVCTTAQLLQALVLVPRTELFKCNKQRFGKIALFPLMSSALSHTEIPKKLVVVACKSFGSHDVMPLEKQW